jgi:hypothetical protein
LLDFALSLFKAEEMNLFRRKPHSDPFSSKFAHGGTLQVNYRCPVDKGLRIGRGKLMQRNGRLLLDAVTGYAIDMLNASGSGHPNFLRSTAIIRICTTVLARTYPGR